MKLVFATHNMNKFKEVKLLLPKHVELLSLNDIGCTEDIEETADTIEGNAALKASFVKQRYGFDCFADDTGLEVSALDGEPGVFSARYAGPEKDSEANIAKLLIKLKGEKDRSARFKTAIALALHDEHTMFLGICDGVITEEKKGVDGFGYDPVFLPNNFTTTFAEMSIADKNEIGHRGKAMRQLIEYLTN
ncbi:non-canonical purine NTP diphosphatase [Cochleicola gelatinilyticus]|uniref:dITP/XTP pyrophosphatase n=1 Tax=Cochleicola gelatinilyticus TaxID=1763537 RepID=A0A167HRD6_9FLAO|nr:non-canonical purine NTP diphosphatase [Cochleicola gelatinilyticus]OAB78884.1 non-canonical purine NTP pyrophosphatase [Cochleicola gelatinilyticus]